MTTERLARAEFMRLCDEVRALEKMTYGLVWKRDHVDLNRHYERLRLTRIAKQRALEELRQTQGRAGQPRTRPVKLDTSVSALLARGERLLASMK